MNALFPLCRGDVAAGGRGVLSVVESLAESVWLLRNIRRRLDVYMEVFNFYSS
jgi:hypothetical protein